MEDVDNSEQAATILGVAEKDLAIAFALDDTSALAASTALGTQGPLLSRSTYAAVARGFDGTSVGDALVTESMYEDWRVVSMRVVPCSPLGPAPVGAIEDLCWPEVRLVLQPVLRNVRIHERSAVAFADDRAIHALYDAPADLALQPVTAARARSLVQRVRETGKAWRGGPFAPLSISELAELGAARDTVVRDMLFRTKALRDPAVPATAYAQHGVRPESADGGTAAAAFAGRVQSFLGRFAKPSALRALTAFSLPEGREPAHLDEWVFLSFKAERGGLVRESITLTSPNDGRVLVDLGMAPVGRQVADDETVHAAARNPLLAPAISARAMLGPADIARLTPVLRDRRTTFVPNTTCASCHKMNALRFDFHSFGYLEDRDLTISPRVVTDVTLDLAWIRSRLDR